MSFRPSVFNLREIMAILPALNGPTALEIPPFVMEHTAVDKPYIRAFAAVLLRASSFKYVY